MQNEEVRDLADKIAQLISTEAKKNDLATLFATIEKLNHRLEKLEGENKVRPSPVVLHPSPSHPSEDRFAVAEAIADAVFDLKSKEKACSFEPNGKPCEHCAMCSSRGF